MYLKLITNQNLWSILKDIFKMFCVVFFLEKSLAGITFYIALHCRKHPWSLFIT